VQEDEDDDSPVHIELQTEVVSDESLNNKKAIVSCIYKNLQDIMEYSGTVIERIRDTSLPTKYGLVNDLC